jgi:L-asparaginase II
VSPPVLAEVVRSGIIESVHRGSVIALDADGSRALAVGSPDEPLLPRSANKPFQAAGMRAAGLTLEGALLALAAASHSGEAHHLAGVQEILAGAELDATALRCPPDVPYGVAARLAWLRAGRGPERLTMNCSGKHAAMLATCVTRGWPVTTYLDPAHPLQVLLRESIEERAGETVATVAVDGCGAPLFALSLAALARAVRSLVVAAPGDPGLAVADAMRGHPDFVGGAGRDVTALMEGVPGLLVKDGAEGVYVAALDDGRAVALKVEDGSARACVPVLVSALRALGVEADVLDRLAQTPVSGGGQQVGVIRALPGLFG